MKRICIWSSPRNVSTALMYSFAQRSDTIVVDEPLYGHYLKISDADHPGKEEIIKSMESDGEKVINEIILGHYDKDVVVFKQMAHHLIEIDESFLYDVTNVFLIRNPLYLINSLSKVLDKVEMRDTGIKRQFEIYEKLDLKNHKSVVVDSMEILNNPESVLTKLCNSVNISFDKNMLSWKAGGRKEDGIWAKFWYDNVRKSTCFEKQESDGKELDPDLISLYNECLPYYNKLFSLSLKSD